MVKGKSRIALSLFFICLLAFLGFLMTDQDKEKAAVNASKAWLKLVDEGKHSESWDEAAQYFKNAITREQWKTSLESVRNPLGKDVFHCSLKIAFLKYCAASSQLS